MFDIAALSAWDFWFWGGLLIVATLVSFYFAFRNLNRARIIEDMPTSKVRSAHQGYVELNGVTEYLNGEALVAPLTNKPCCWYRYSIQKRSDKNWRTVESETSSAPFLLRDETGACVIDPEGAEVSADLKKVWSGFTRRPPGAAVHRPGNRPARGLLDGLKMRSGISFNFAPGLDLSMDLGAGGYRYSEEWIPAGSPLYAIGLFRSLDDGDHQQSRQAIMRDLLREWKQNAKDLLARFDHDRDGRIDTQEWEQARAAASREAAEIYRAQLENMVVHTLGPTGSRRRPFLLATTDQSPLARRYRIFAAVSIGLFFVIGGIAAYLFVGRFLT